MVRIAALLTALVACKSTVDTAGFEKNLETRVSEIGLKADKVACPKGIEAKVGAEFTCSITIEGTAYDLKVTIKSVDKEKKDVQMDTVWAKGDAVVRHKVVEAVGAQLGEQLGTKVALDCGTEPLVFLVNSTSTCKLTAGAAVSTLTIEYQGLDPKSWKLEPKLLSKKAMEGALLAPVREQTTPTTTVSCGKDDVFARPADGKATCDVNIDGQARQIYVFITPDLQVEKWESIPVP